MRRKIKFRCWNTDTNSLIDPRGLAIQPEDGVLIYANDPAEFGLYDSSNYVLEQFTGLRDKNGVEIYEGDIVGTELGAFCVVFSEKFAGWYIEKPDGHREFLFGALGNVHTNMIIGNIHENPDLLG
ncbi:hypothetical protein C5C99_08955 [Rathayibacter sp. AY1C4]|uniref:YopX family protein n=1 Tax=Rathayibacter sp. AY1C4 TaxID=2080537 RepID=UPI000CE9103F|nr:YopX family protein [Rathayibacter sp. AY1C4]PPH20473.1 hypothetical protein C5C99_08955 [Rathayibacter sp. AY1C4]